MAHSDTSRPVNLPPVWASALLFLFLAWWSRDLYGVDVDAFLLPWFTHIRATGPLAAFAVPFANYTPPYLYLMAAFSPFADVIPSYAVIKLLSFAGHLALIGSVWRLLVAFGHRHPARAAMVLACAPTLFVNPAIMTQCDAMWAALTIAALTAAIERRHATMLAWCGLAVAIKLQAAFLAPFFLALVLARRVPIRFWLFAPAAAVLAMVPAWALGWPAGNLATIYFRQAQWEETIALDAPNVWMIVQSVPALAARSWSGIAFAATLAAVIGYVIVFARRIPSLDRLSLLRTACLCAMIVPMLLPRMHERYFFMADVLALVIVVVRPAEWRLALLTQAGSGLAILAYMTGNPALATIGATAMIAATWIAARPFVTADRQAANSAADLVTRVTPSASVVA